MQLLHGAAEKMQFFNDFFAGNHAQHSIISLKRRKRLSGSGQLNGRRLKRTLRPNFPQNIT